MSARPSYVAKEFAGGCKVFPKPRTDGREPMLLDYQQRWVLDESRLKAAEKSRQIGWTFTEAYAVTRRQSLKEARLDSWISSRDEIQARLFIEDCKAWAGLLQVGGEDLGQQVIDPEGHTAYMLRFANGLRIHSMSSNPDAQAGKRGSRTLDEFPLHKDPRKLYSIAYPGITWGGSLSFFGSHRGTANYFNQLILEAKHKGNPKKLSLHRVTLQDALDDGFLYKLQKKLPEGDERQAMDEAAYFDFIKGGCADEESFLEEFMCIPSDDEGAFISFELLDACKYAPGTDWETDLKDAKGQLYVGVDIGRHRDLTVIWIVERLGNVDYTRRVICLEKQKFSTQEAVLYPLIELPQVRRVCIDKTGMGEQFAERAQQRFGTYKVEPVQFTGAVKEDLAYPIRAALEDRTLRLPDDRDVFADFRSIRKTHTASGNIRFEGERTRNGHADRFWAAALARHAAARPAVQYTAELV